MPRALAARRSDAHASPFCAVSEESHEQRHARFQRIRRLKKLLRFTPRRASLHRYPLIGRFADVARKRSYLWSFRSEHVRPALYAGSIVSFLPIMGVQLPVAFLLCLLLRTNFMVMGGLQFITNPFTAAPVYYATYQLGQTIIRASGFGHSVELAESLEVPPANEPVSPAATATDGEEDDALHPPEHLTWTRRFGTLVNALVLGGVVMGALLGFILDLLWRIGVARAARHRALHPRRPRSGSTVRRTPPM